jgi:hypothetical protein
MPCLYLTERSITVFTHSLLLDCTPGQLNTVRTTMSYFVVLGGILISFLTIGQNVRGIKSGQKRWNLKGNKHLEHAFLRKRSKAVDPMSLDFTVY